MTKKQRPRIGDIVAIPLKAHQCIFGRILEDASIEVFRAKAKEPVMPAGLDTADVLMTGGLFDDAIKSGEWPIVGKIPFANEDDKWPPPQIIRDDISPQNLQIYHKGEIRSASAKEIVGLDEQFMYKPDQLIEEILKRLKGA